MPDSERAEHAGETLFERLWPFLIHTLFVLPGSVALYPYSMRPVDTTTPAYIAPFEYMVGMGPYLAAHPFRAVLVLITCLWMAQMLRGVPRV